jgi:hypothetical protein
MAKFIAKDEKKCLKEARTFKNPQNKTVNRFQQNAARLEHPIVRKGKGKKG